MENINRLLSRIRLLPILQILEMPLITVQFNLVVPKNTFNCCINGEIGSVTPLTTKEQLIKYDTTE